MRPLTPAQRDEFLDKAAMMAMQALLAIRDLEQEPGRTRAESTASAAYYCAQALLAERDRREQVKE